MKAVVIGAGLAGLAALHALTSSGAEAVCFEKAGVPGGRVITARREGFIFDLGAQFFFHSYNTCFQLAKEFGLYDDLTTWECRSGLLNKGRFLPIVPSTNPRDIATNLGETLRFVTKAGIPFQAMRQFLGLLPTLVKRHKDLDLIDFERALDLDNESLADFVLRRGGQAILDYYIHSLAAGLTLAKADDLSAMYGLSLLCSMIKGVLTFRHGLGCISERLGDRYAGCIHYQTPVQRIVIEQGKVKGVEVNGGLVEADAVIPAVTATSLLEMAPGLPESLKRPLQQVTYSACCHVIFALPAPLFPKDWYALLLHGRTGACVSAFCDNSMKSPYYSPQGCAQIGCWTYDRHARELNDRPDAEVRRVLVKEIQRYMPHMPDTPLFTEIYRWCEAVCIAPPGMLGGIAHLKRNNYRDVKGLYLAGEYLHMPSVESAAKSGIDAARAALR